MSSAESQHVRAHKGFFGVVAGDEVAVSQAGAGAFLSSGNMSIERGGGRLMVVGGDASISQGGGNAIFAGGDITISQGGGAIVAARSIELERSYVGVALGGSVALTDSTVVMTPATAAAFGAGVALTLFGLRKLFGR